MSEHNRFRDITIDGMCCNQMFCHLPGMKTTYLPIPDKISPMRCEMGCSPSLSIYICINMYECVPLSLSVFLSLSLSIFLSLSLPLSIYIYIYIYVYILWLLGAITFVLTLIIG